MQDLRRYFCHFYKNNIKLLLFSKFSCTFAKNNSHIGYDNIRI